MTNGTAAALILTDAILGRPNAWADLYDAKRLKPLAAGGKFLRANAAVAAHFVGDRLRRGEDVDLAELGRGEGVIIGQRGRKTAVHRDDDGRLHAVSPVCTHMGCHLSWNPVERSWDCPCHGSRFTGEGAVIQGPATRDLARRDVGSGAARS
jgi:nitrite reductase/ring-hydroxylating ferredoxin subunit